MKYEISIHSLDLVTTGRQHKVSVRITQTCSLIHEAYGISWQVWSGLAQLMKKISAEI